ncbi:DNA topoisomerase 1 alpha [Raphanus sativus]|uniref:DNA topoisomerase I n=1 Tax=Raphanus sativus TaxID=3726 RepID=A0A6J0MF85_RAPSA|nr:DNA topoisomerase 1 alpha [Raphanus sativus]
MDSKPVIENGIVEDSDDEKPIVFKRTSGVVSNSKSNTQRSNAVSSTKASPLKSPVAASSNGTTPSNRTSAMTSSKPSPAKTPLQNEEEDSDDDKPIVFKRTSGAASNSKSNTQRSNAVSSTKASPLKSPVTKPNGTTASNKTSSKALPAKPPLRNDTTPSSVKAKGQSQKEQSECKSERDDSDSDSDDEKPLSSIRTGNSSRSNKGPASSKQVASPQAEEKNTGGRPLDGADRVIKDESDDEKPISSMVQKKSGMSGSQKVSSDEKKPLMKKLNQNGSAVKNEVPDCKVSGKRPVEKNHPVDESSSKKPKVSASSTSGKMKQEPVKTESSADKGRVLVSPTAKRARPVSIKEDDSDDDNVPISKRLKSESSNSKVSSAKPKAVKGNSSSSAAKPKVTKVVSPPSRSKTVNRNAKKVTKDSKYSSSSKSSPSSSDGQTKWTTLEHNGVIFPPLYKPHGIKILYKGKPVDLTIEQEEVATMFAVMKETDYYTKPQFRENFWNDWRKLLGKKHVIQKLDDCDFTPIYEWHLREKEKKKQMTTEEKKALKEEKLKLEEKYMWAVVDGVKEKVGNFRVEPPGLFRGRGEHPKMGKLKKRIRPSDITMNIGKGVPVPECPIPGEKWKDVKHDNTVTWLAFWNDPINPKEFKYVFLAASSALKGLSDKEKYEKARNLTNHIDSIRATYTKNFTSKDVTKKQIAVATYLIDKLALRAGNEKDDDEADTVGCCTLKVGNVECIPPNKIKFDFLGKDSIRYENTVEVESLVYKAIGQFQSGKSKEDDLFDELDTSKLNAHLKELVPGLTAKVFRTYNASFTLDDQLNEKMGAGDVSQKVVVYQQANKKVAIICNHQRAVSKSHSAQIEKLDAKLKELENGLKEFKTNLKRAKEGKPPVEGSDGKKPRNLDPNAWEKKIGQQEVKIEKMKRDMHTKEELKTVALGTSKINYLDPRITVAWCKRNEVPIEKIFTKSLLEKFSWAMDAEPDFRF